MTWNTERERSHVLILLIELRQIFNGSDSIKQYRHFFPDSVSGCLRSKNEVSIVVVLVRSRYCGPSGNLTFVRSFIGFQRLGLSKTIGGRTFLTRYKR